MEKIKEGTTKICTNARWLLKMKRIRLVENEIIGCASINKITF